MINIVVLSMFPGILISKSGAIIKDLFAQLEEWQSFTFTAISLNSASVRETVERAHRTDSITSAFRDSNENRRTEKNWM
jgi:hypothetical protein